MTEPSPLVSVVIPVRDGAAFVQKAIDSVLAQTHARVEIIPVDDGSRDDTAAVVREAMARDPRVRLVQQPPTGLSAARNTGIRESRGEFVAFLDADDWWLPPKLAAQLAVFAAHPDAGLVYSGATRVYGDGRVQSEYRPQHEGMILDDLLRNGNIISGSASSAIVRRAVLDAVGGFDERLPAVEDWDMWMRVAARFPVYAVHEQHVRILFHNRGLGYDPARMRDLSLGVVERAFAEHARGRRALESRALARIYMTASYGYNELGDRKRERRDLFRCIRHHPAQPHAYRRLLRSLLPF